MIDLLQTLIASANQQAEQTAAADAALEASTLEAAAEGRSVSTTEKATHATVAAKAQSLKAWAKFAGRP